MTNQTCERYSRQYAQYIAKEVVKEAAAHIFDDLRATLTAHFKENPEPGCDGQAARVMELLSDVECRYYNEFKVPEVFEEVVER